MMQKEEFKKWLSDRRTQRSVTDCISRCLNIEKSMSINLDDEYKKDKGAALLSVLSYGKNDADKGISYPAMFSFKAGINYVQRFADLKSSAKQYFLFCEWLANIP